MLPGVAALRRALRLGRAGAALPRTACRARRLGDPPPGPGAAGTRAYAAEGGGSAAAGDEDGAADAAASIHGMSKKKQRHHLNQLLKSLGAGPAQREAMERIMPMTVVDVNRTTKVTKGGSLMRFTATVVCGNGSGLAGWGKGKASEVSVAVDKAHARAQRNLYFFDLYRGHTIFHDVKQKYGGTTVLLRAAPSGTGVQVSVWDGPPGQCGRRRGDAPRTDAPAAPGEPDRQGHLRAGGDQGPAGEDHRLVAPGEHGEGDVRGAGQGAVPRGGGGGAGDGLHGGDPAVRLGGCAAAPRLCSAGGRARRAGGRRRRSARCV